MDEFAYFHQVDVPTLIHVVLFWVGGVVAVDYWVSARRSDSTRQGKARHT